MKQEADKLRTRAAAGEDIAKLQQEAYDFADYKLKAPNPRMDKVRKASIPPADVSIFELKKGEVSQVFNDPAGFMVYKVEAVEDLPIASVREEIARTLQTEKTKNAFDSLQNSAKTTLDESYFATPAPPSLKNPGEAPTAENPAPGKK
jgi:PPIC-type PPIASE domain